MLYTYTVEHQQAIFGLTFNYVTILVGSYLQYSVKVDAFEGPLDLLLHLINRYEIDIYDIPVAVITDQYMSYIHTMQELELDIASEYLVMAATLLAIKSKMLLPKHENTLEEDFEMQEEEDPRDELMNRLIEYRKYKMAADELKALEAERSQVYSKPLSDLKQFVGDEPPAANLLDGNIYDMLGAFQQLLKRQRIEMPRQTRINRQEIPIQSRMAEIMEELERFSGKRSFYELFPYPEKDHLVVTFLALLELLKLNKISCEQESNFSDLLIYRNEGAGFIGSE